MQSMFSHLKLKLALKRKDAGAVESALHALLLTVGNALNVCKFIIKLVSSTLPSILKG